MWKIYLSLSLPFLMEFRRVRLRVSFDPTALIEIAVYLICEVNSHFYYLDTFIKQTRLLDTTLLDTFIKQTTEIF